MPVCSCTTGASHTWDHAYWRGDLKGVEPRFRIQPSAGALAGRAIERDDAGKIVSRLNNWIDDHGIDAIVTTGGTTYRVGDTVRFVTTIANSGGAVAAASVAKVVLPTNLTLVSGSIRIGTAEDGNFTYAVD